MNNALSPSRRLLLAAIASTAAAALLPACGRKAKGQAVPAGATVLALGDSLTQGVGTSSPAHAWPAVFERLSGWRMVNGGVSGDTSDMALARLPALLREHRPQLVIVSIGGNDFLHQQSGAATRDNIRAIVQQSQSAGAQVLLVAEPQPSIAAALGRVSDHPMFAELAGELRVPLLENAWSDILSDEKLRSDRIHANDTGYEQFARVLLDATRTLGFAPH
ncbi:MAG: arylesterase [Ottowia sp.]|nr:arylesterase [Ottowia sp.]